MTLYEELLKGKRVLPGLTDPVFKKIMISHKDYLGLILEYIIPITKEQVEKEGIFLNVEIPSSQKSFKMNRLDLLLQVGKYYINLEANNNLSNALRIRNEAHLSGLVYYEYSRKGKRTLEEILYQVAFNRQKRLSKELIVRLQYWDKKLNVGEENILKVEINLEFVSNKYYNKEELSRFEKALLMLVIEDEEELKRLGEGDELLEEVGKDIISYSRAKEIVIAYESQMIEENYRNNLAHEQGHAEGHAEGRAEGLVEGIEEGTIKNKIEIAKLMLKDDVPKDKISKYTRLSLDEIQELEVKQLQNS